MVSYKYLVADLDNDSVKEKVKLFARLVYKLGMPNPKAKDITTHRWPRYKHPTLKLGAMAFEPNYIIKFRLKRPDGTFSVKAIAAIEEFITIWYPNVTASKKTQMRNYVKNNAGAKVEQMLPNNLENGLEFKTQLEIDKWFETE